MIKLAIFAAVSALLVLLNLSWLRRRRSHGFYRFFAFEFLAALILLNLESWFLNPFSPRQLVSWAILLGSLYMAIQGFRLLRSAGKPKGGVVDTTSLVTRGIYRYVRHPLYSSLFLLGWGIFVKAPSIPGLVLVHGAMFSVFFTARAEEKENLVKFGPGYATYMRRTKRYLPFLF